MAKTEILQLLEAVNAAYLARAVDQVDSVMATLFDPDTAAYVTGTSSAELSFDSESIKKLFISDWQYWGDLRLDIQNAVIKNSDNFAWIHCPGTLKYSFSGGEETYSKFVGYIKEYYDGSSYDSQKPADVRLAEINWLLAHLLHDRQQEQGREYLWQIRVFFVARKIGASWKFRHIQFSLPHNDPFADARFSEHTYFEKLYKKESEMFASCSGIKLLEEDEKLFWDDFCRSCLCGAPAAAIPAGRFFDPEVLLVDSNNRTCQGEESVIGRCTELKEYWCSIRLDTDAALVDKSGNYIWLHGTGVFRKKMTRDFLNQLTEKSIQDLFERPIPDKEKLFLIRRNIALQYMEMAYGEDFEIPVRFEACIVRRQESLLVDYFQFSLPFINVLEQINEEF